MRKLVLLNLILCFFQVTHSQDDLINISLLDTRLDVLYTNVCNIISAGVHDNIRLHGPEGEAQQIAPGKFCVKVSRTGRETLKLYRNDSLILTKDFDIYPIGDLRVGFGGVFDTVVRKSEIVNQPYLLAYHPYSYCNIFYRIIAVKLTTKSKTGTQSFEMKSKTSDFVSAGIDTLWLEKGIVNGLSTLHAGDKIVIENIVVSDVMNHKYSVKNTEVLIDTSLISPLSAGKAYFKLRKNPDLEDIDAVTIRINGTQLEEKSGFQKVNINPATIDTIESPYNMKALARFLPGKKYIIEIAGLDALCYRVYPVKETKMGDAIVTVDGGASTPLELNKDTVIRIQTIPKRNRLDFVIKINCQERIFYTSGGYSFHFLHGERITVEADPFRKVTKIHIDGYSE